MSLEQRVNSIQALALQSLTGKVDALNPTMEGSVTFNAASGDNNIFTIDFFWYFCSLLSNGALYWFFMSC